MFKDGAMFLIGFVGGLIVTVVFIVISMPSGQGKGVGYHGVGSLPGRGEFGQNGGAYLL